MSEDQGSLQTCYCAHKSYMFVQVYREHWAAKLRGILDFTVKQDGQVFNRVESTEYLQATIVVYTHEYPITLHMVGIG